MIHIVHIDNASVRQVLNMPGLKRIEWKSHDDVELIFATAPDAEPVDLDFIFNQLRNAGVFAIWSGRSVPTTC